MKYAIWINSGGGRVSFMESREFESINDADEYAKRTYELSDGEWIEIEKDDESDE